MSRESLDLTLYLVTGRELLPPGKDYLESLEEAIEGGVTVVQVREKTADTAEFLEIAAKTKEICHKHGILVLINDRIDIALAIGADGVHLGQSDMPIAMARKLLPKDSIIGVSVNTASEAIAVKAEGLADYIGIGPIWPTKSKRDLHPILGPRSVGPILDELEGTKIKSVVIGGISSTNVLRTLYGSVGPKSGRTLDGVAVISAIVASKESKKAAIQLKETTASFMMSNQPIATGLESDERFIVKMATSILADIKKYTPLVHQITNNVTINQLANATLALGASPIMATAPEEMEDLSKIPGALLINFGTIRDKESMLSAGRFANLARKPVIFDPVGIGATQFRREVGNELLNHWQATVIKGNAAEIAALARSTEVSSRGVDSVGSGFTDPVAVVKDLARRERCIVVMSGVKDYISDGQTTYELSNGHPLLSSFSGSGCMLGAVIASFCGAADVYSRNSGDGHPATTQLAPAFMLTATIGGVLALTIAAEVAAEKCSGPGTYLQALIDALYYLKPEDISNKAKIKCFA